MDTSILQKVRRCSPAVSVDFAWLVPVLGLSLFFAWNLMDIYAEPVVSFDWGGAGSEWLYAVSSVCNIFGYVVVGVLVSRSAAFPSFVAAVSVVAGFAAAVFPLLAISEIFDAVTAFAAYRGVTRFCSAAVVVAWGGVFSRMDAHELTLKALVSLVAAGVVYLVVNSLPGVFRVVLVAALLPCSALLYRRALGDEAFVGVAAKRESSLRPFLALTWRGLTVLLFMGLITWTVIIQSRQQNVDGQGGSYVALVSLALSVALLFLAVSCRGVLSYSFIYKIALPLVMTGILFVGSFSLAVGVGFTLVSVGFTCLDLFCFVMVANACKRSGVRAEGAFCWYRAIECSVPLFALALLHGFNLFGNQDGSFLNPLGFGCALAVAVSLLFGGGRVFETNGGGKEESYPKVEILQFAMQCESAIKKYGLSERESEVLGLIVRGRSVPYISERLHISKTTTKTHVTHIYQKLGVNDRQEMLDLIEGMEIQGR